MKKSTLLISAFAFLFTSCDKDKAIATDITINFIHTVDGSDLITNSMIYTNEAGENYDVQTLKYLMSDITLHSENGSSLLLDEVHFIDISDESTFNFTYNDVPNNNYTSISFDMGLDSSNNISDLYVSIYFSIFKITGVSVTIRILEHSLSMSSTRNKLTSIFFSIDISIIYWSI